MSTRGRARRRAAALAAGFALLAGPAAAEAHGIVQRSNLPIPEWLFAWAAAIVLIASFFALGVLWARPQLEQPPWRPLPRGLGRALAGPGLRRICAVIGVAAFALVVAAGYLDPGEDIGNLASTFILIVFWVGLAFASVLFGDLFAVFSPWRAVRLPGLRPYPERWGRYPAALALLGFTWIELVGQWGGSPPLLASAALAYTAYTLAMQYVFGTEAWTQRGEAFAVYFGLFARLSVWERRGDEVGVRRPLGGLARLDLVPGTVAFVCVMIGTVTYDGFGQGQLGRDAIAALTRGLDGLLGDDLALGTARTLGLLAGVALVAGFYRLGIAGARSVGGRLDAARLRGAFVHSLVPVAFVYVAAHYLTFLLFEGQAAITLASDPFGSGWNLLGTVARGIDYSLLDTDATWYLQVGLVVCGHVAALVLAHDRALSLYRDPRLAVRSQYWMLAVMVGFTSLALWLLTQAAA